MFVAWPVMLSVTLGLAGEGNQTGKLPVLIRSAAGGPWSQPATWEGGKVPGAGVRVQIRTGHVVTFDARTEGAIRSIHVAGDAQLRSRPRHPARRRADQDPGRR